MVKLLRVDKSNSYNCEDCFERANQSNEIANLDLSCKMLRGSKNKPLWKWIDGGCYAFNEHGQMYCDWVTPDGWRGANGLR